MIGLSTSCQKELAGGQEPAGNKPFTITASIAGSGTKVSYAEDGTSHALTPSWVVGDVIIGFDGDGNTYGYSVTEVNTETKKATLAIITEGDNAGGKTENPANDTKMYMFYAPGKKPTDIGTKSLTVSLASQAEDVVPALMMAQATVADNSLSLVFENETAIIGVKSPTMAMANKAYTSLALSGSVGLNTAVKFDLNGETLQASYQTAGTITKALNFNSDASTKQGPDVIYIVACPLATAADLTFTFNGNEEYFKVAGATMEAGSYYYMTPTTGKQKFAITVQDGITGGTISTSPSGNVAWGTEVTVTATPNTGYELTPNSITVTDAGSGSVTVNANKFTMPQSNVTVSGSFQKKDFAITPTGTGSGTYAVTGGTYTVEKSSTAVTTAQMGDVITVTPDPADGYSGGTVTVAETTSGNSVTVTGNTFTMPAADVTITVSFNHDEYDIAGNVSPSLDAGTVKFKKSDSEVTKAHYEEEITVDDTPAAGYELVSIKWKEEGGSDTDITTEKKFTMPAKKVTVTVTFKKTDFNITKNAATHGSFTVKNGATEVEKANYQDQITVVPAPDDGYVLDAITVKDAADASVTVTNGNFTMPAKAVTVSVTFKAQAPGTTPDYDITPW